MSIIQWKPSLSVGIEGIDLQHRRLFDLINTLDQSIREHKTNVALSKTLDELIAYANEHFSAEEKMMVKAEYPNLKSHLVEHKFFRDKVTEFRTAFASGKLGLTRDVMNFMTDWLLDHISRSDQKYAPYLR